MTNHAEGETPSRFPLQILLQDIAGDSLKFDGFEIRHQVLADAITAGGGGGQLPFASDEREKGVANPIADQPDTNWWLTGTRIDGQQPLGHGCQRFGSRHRRAWS